MPINSPYNNLQRVTRSGSNSSAVNLQELRALIETSKNEILKVVNSEIGKLNDLTSMLIDRLSNLEKSQERLDRECKHLRKEIDSLKSSKATAPEDVVEEVSQRIGRKNNLIISGLPESEVGGHQERRERDRESVMAVLDELNEGDAEVTNVFRIGPKVGMRSRLLRLECHSGDSRAAILRKAKTLHSSQDFKHVFIRPDLTRKQRAIALSLRAELKERRDKGENVTIRKGKVIIRNQPSFQ